MKKNLISLTTRSFLFSLIFCLVGLSGLSIYVFLQSRTLGNKIYPNVYINSVPFGRAEEKDVDEYFSAVNKELEKVILEIQYEEEIATFSAKKVGLRFDNKTPKIQALSIGRSANTQTRIYQNIVTILNLGEFRLNYRPDFDPSPINDYIAVLKEAHEKPPTNALFEIKNGRVTAFKKEEDGVTIESDAAMDKIEQTISSLKIPLDDNTRKIVITLEQTISQPDITLEEVNDLGIVEEIGRGTSDYSGSIPGRVHNVILATSKFNGVIIPKGKAFSFNQTIGDISAATGYEQAYIIKQGQTVLGDGGGVCQVSTTLFRAVLDAGLPIVERSAHAYRVHYYENDRQPGFDATVFSPTVDFKFKNDTETAILLQTSIDKVNRIVTFTLYGKKDGRTRTISEATIWGVVSPPEPRYQDDPTLPSGTKKQVDWAAPGTKAKFHYRVEKNGEVIQDRDFVSNYRPWQAVYLVGTGG